MSSKAKFTKGPYEASMHPGKGPGYTILGPLDGLGKPQLATVEWAESNERTAAQANFFAAVWDLYEALKDLFEAEEEYGDPANAAINPAWLKARTALQKARGEHASPAVEGSVRV